MRMIRFQELGGRCMAVSPQLVGVVGECSSKEMSNGAVVGCTDCEKHPGHWYVMLVNSQAWGVSKRVAFKIIKERDRAMNRGDEWQGV